MSQALQDTASRTGSGALLGSALRVADLRHELVSRSVRRSPEVARRARQRARVEASLLCIPDRPQHPAR